MSTHQKGLTKALRSLNSHTERNLAVMRKVMIVQGEKVSTKAKDLVNVDLGTLKGSINSQFLIKGDQYIVIIGANTDYALAVHENPNLRGYKYLEKPFIELFSEIDNLYKKAL